MGIFSDRESVAKKLSEFADVLGNTYKDLADQKCPAVASKLPLLRQGVYICVAHGKEPFIILSKDSKQPPWSFVSLETMIGTWDESEHPDLSRADCIDDIVRILELEEIIFYMKLDSLEPDYLDKALGRKETVDLAERMLEEHIRTLKPTFEDKVDRMQQAYELLFRLENKLRMLIEKRLKEKFGETDWWTKGATHTAKDRYKRRQQDPRRRWHLLASATPLSFVDFEDLHDIIVNKNAVLFQNCVGPIDRFSSNMKSLEIPRNLIAHNNALPPEEYYHFRRTVETLLRVIEPNLT